MSESVDFQNQARMHARRAAEALRTAAAKLDEAYPLDCVQPADTMFALEHIREATHRAITCLGHASHQSALAVLHREREKAQEENR